MKSICRCTVKNNDYLNQSYFSYNDDYKKERKNIILKEILEHKKTLFYSV